MTLHIPALPLTAAALPSERAALRALRKAIADRIEADIALLDALDGDPDLEDGHDAEDVTLAMRGGLAA
ncbi:MAG: hypothetical protein K2X71_29090 [Methylobacterium sp.]|uniref:hypothetical protein n=1 Tax=Methylobacterium sp. TaxID=409 RepID=UPI002583A232|nr:hypothetical protein [Methylobacterium sp.]MBY0300047.1 hypothetical protein [Methylobacterium sp.]